MKRLPCSLGLLVLLATACGGSSDEVGSCPDDQRALQKAWFVGDPEETGDEPELTLTITVTEARFGPSTMSSFVGASVSAPVTAEILESSLVLRDAGGEVLSAFEVLEHSASACGSATFRENPGKEPHGVFVDRPVNGDAWFRVIWSKDLAGAERYAFDIATAAGYPDAAQYEPLEHYVPDFYDGTDDDRVAFPGKTFVTFNAIDDQTLGCAFDIPDAQGSCPLGELTLAYELTR